jgi:hypothetical protein
MVYFWNRYVRMKWQMGSALLINTTKLKKYHIAIWKGGKTEAKLTFDNFSNSVNYWVDFSTD